MPSTVRFANNGVFNESIQYKYDSMGNIIEVFENGRSACRYEYDALGRLTREDNVAFEKTTTWVYDNNGNIIAKYEYAITAKPTSELHLLDCTCVNYAYDDNSDQLMSYNGETFEYDVIGNPTTYRGKAATWEYGKQLTAYDGNTFSYDARGRRTAKNGITFTYDSNGNLIKQNNGLEFLYDHTGVFAVKHGTQTYFYRKDAQGNIVALIDSNGSVVVKYKYDAWGNCHTTVVDSTAGTIGELNPFRYRSYYFDTETGFYFLKTRYYDPEIGRFMTIDDISYLDPESINGLNLYAYCGNNPVNRIDPWGCDWWNPFTWDWQGMFNSIGSAFSTACQWLNNNVLNPVGNFFANNWDIVLGLVATIGFAALSIVTFGIATVAIGMIIGAIVGAGFGALNAYINGDSVLYGAISGALVGALSGVGGPGLKGIIFAGIASALGAATTSLIGDRVNNRPRDFKTAGLSAVTAGVFSFLGNGFGNYLASAGPELVIQIAANSMGAFYFSSYIFIADAIVKTVSGG